MLKEIIKNHKDGKLGGDKYVLQLKNGALNAFNSVTRCRRM